MLLAELEQKASAPASLSADALALQRELTTILLMRCSILNTNACIEIRQSSMNTLASSIERCYNTLIGHGLGEAAENAAEPPVRRDPSQAEQQIRDILEIIDSKDIRRILQAVDAPIPTPDNP